MVVTRAHGGSYKDTWWQLQGTSQERVGRFQRGEKELATPTALE